MVKNLHNSVRSTCVVFLFVCTLFGQSIQAGVGGPYVLDWTTIDGGGGTSSGGQYTLSGTIGQPDANINANAGGSFELLGGFWPGMPLCFVDLGHFARFAQYWLETGDSLPADLYKDENNIVDLLDLEEFINEWLCRCPYNWPLK